MKSIHISEDIVSLTDFKNHASKMLHNVQDTHRPLIITQNGKPSGVLISPVEFDLLSEQNRFVQAVRNGLHDVEQGRVISDAELENTLNEASMD